MAKSLLIVESPAKARTIGKYLGSDYEVKASVGHIRDLPTKTLGVDIENGFEPEYATIQGKQKIITELKKAAKGKEAVFLAPDPDREGEAIAWHIAEALKSKGRVFHRVLFHELTKKAIEQALANPQELSIPRFESQQARRVLDRLVGYQISPLLWSRVKRGLSAGRVQSVALMIIIGRERAIFAFTPEEYWSLTAFLAKDGQEFSAKLLKKGRAKIKLANAQETQAVVDAVRGRAFTVAKVESKERKRNPSPPFTTSQLQQEAFGRLRFSTSRTMRVAQQLYEGVELGADGSVGLITYMRTDSVRVAGEALAMAREHIEKNHGPSYLPAKPNFYSNKKGSQDAHEAIRPTSVARTPEKVKPFLSPQQHALYELVWRRFVASQMKPALIDQTAADIEAGGYTFRATGSVIKFKGFMELYERAAKDDKEVLPPLVKGEALQLQKLDPRQHFTQPPPRFTEATLVRELEENGIGRPSTYASIISTLKNKEYIEAVKTQLKPTELGFLVNDLLAANFERIMDVEFTARMENDLDAIEEGRANWREVLASFYESFEQELAQAEEKMLSLKKDGVATELKCPACEADMVLKWGRNGPFLSCSRYPECKEAMDYERGEDGRLRPIERQELETEEVCEKCGRKMVVKKGRYGPFLACPAYPECKNTKPLAEAGDQGEIPPLPEGVDETCQKCGAQMVVKRARKGNLFISCANYPKCKSAMPFPTGVDCPKKDCGGQLVERSSKKGLFYGCTNYPKCRYIAAGRPEKKPCPICGHPFLVRDEKTGGLACPKKDCAHTE